MNRRATFSRPSDQLRGFFGNEKVFVPLVAARVEKGDILRVYPVPPRRCHRLVDVAGFTRESKVLRTVVPAGRTWMNMLNFKSKVEDLFRSTTVFTAMPGPFRNRRIK